MGIEIERKFLLANDDWREQAGQPTRYRQGYMTRDDKASVRVRIQGERAYLNIKSATLGIFRHEFEYPLPIDDANQLLDELCYQPLIEKDRYVINYAEHEWEIDVFMGDNEGLVVAEVELGSEDEAFEKPSWLGEEVSHDKRYYNVCLVTHPYKEW